MSLEDTDDDDTFDVAVRTRPEAGASSEDNFGNLPALTEADHHDLDEGDLERLYVTASEEHMLHSLEVRNRRVLNERLITAVRQLYSEKEITSQQAKFWEGAFGALKHKPVTQAGLKMALHTESKTFLAIHLRQQLYEAMFQRDLPRITELIGKSCFCFFSNRL